MRCILPSTVNQLRIYPNLLLSATLFLFLVIHDAHGSPREWNGRSNLTVSQVSAKYKDRLTPVPQCQGATYCEDVPNYPTDIINQEIMKDPSVLYHSSVDMVSSVAQRTNMASAEALCLSNEKVIYPKTAQCANGQWLYVVNSGEFVQGVRVETCMQEDGSCRVIDGFAQGYKTSCKQKYIFRELSAMNVNGKITREYFRFPASCCCHVEFTGA